MAGTVAGTNSAPVPRMFLDVFKTDGLAQIGYLVGDGHHALAIDPTRDVEPMLEAARRRGVGIETILETHRNEDYVVGSRELAERTGAHIHHGVGLDFGYGRPAREGDVFEAGSVELRTLETPGHTPESLSFVLRDRSTGDGALAVFTGDALFVGDVGRTDLTGDARRAAESLYQSLHEKLLPLGDQVVVHPAHGAGSVCGEHMADRDFSTLGYERAHNPMLQLDREAFVDAKLREQHVVPPYFAEMEVVNKEGPPVLGHLPDPWPLGPDEVAARVAEGARVVDVRSAEAFVGASIPGALSLPLGLVTAYAGWLLPPDQVLVLVAERRSDVDEAVRALTNVGRTRIRGWLAAGMKGWETSGRPIARFPVAHAEEVAARAREGSDGIIDVRKGPEYAAGHLPGAHHVFLGDLPGKLGIGALPAGPLVTVCGSGQRATVAASLLAGENREVAVALGPMAACATLDCPTTTA